jgi:hydroxyacylglutathione hydrolase
MREGIGYQLHMIDVGNRLANYIYVLICTATQTTIVIDPTEAAPVLEFLHTHQLTLHYILNTHHHDDHVHGNAALKAFSGATIIGSSIDAARIPHIDVGVRDGQKLQIGDFKADIIDISGHTLGHIAFYLRKEKLLFSGDTLFSAGCGRMFEGTPAQYHASLQKIAQLPHDTLICGAHEYTLTNCQFALQYEPENTDLLAHYAKCQTLRAEGKPTIPTTLGLELRINPFLRTHSTSIRETLALANAEDKTVFAALRAAKDVF